MASALAAARVDLLVIAGLLAPNFSGRRPAVGPVACRRSWQRGGGYVAAYRVGERSSIKRHFKPRRLPHPGNVNTCCRGQVITD